MKERSLVSQSFCLLRLRFQLAQDLVLARQRTRQIAAALGFDEPAQTRIVTALSEILRNAFRYAGGGVVDLAVEGKPDRKNLELPPEQVFLLTVQDCGPGIPDWILKPRPTDSKPRLGLGLAGARRLMDAFQIESAPGRTVITMRKILPLEIPPHTPKGLEELIKELARQAPESPAEEVQVQNQELLRTLNQLREREQELVRINQELTDTNTGVLALYDELDTLHRVGLKLAERHHLHDLLQTIIDSTTDLTGADLGAFYYHESSPATWRLNAIAGRERGILAQLPQENPPGLFEAGANGPAVCRIDDASADPSGHTCSIWIRMLGKKYPLGSCLFVPVLTANQELAGALVFGHARKGAFSERSERIIAAVAVHAAIGIEKARLFQGLQTASDAKDRFLAMLSHELRTPLSPVTAILTALSEENDLPERVRADVAVMRRNIELEARIIDDLLDFNRIIRGKLELNRAPVDLHGLIQAVVHICKGDLSELKQELSLQLVAEHSEVSGDSARLQQVLWNVLKNAIKFTPSGGAISISTSIENPPGMIRLQIADTGCGIEQRVLPTVFSAFEQGFQNGRYGGLGLGLAIAKAFVDLHGGQITASSDGHGQGSRFQIRLPLLLQAQSSSGATPDEPVPPSQPPDGQRILLVDDHPDTLRTLARLLTRRRHLVTSAMTCAEALARARQESFDLLISDIGLPDRSGLELVAELQRIQPIPSIALSGYGMETDLANSQAAGFDRHLIKPVNFPLLQQTISELCRPRLNLF